MDPQTPIFAISPHPLHSSFSHAHFPMQVPDFSWQWGGWPRWKDDRRYRGEWKSGHCHGLGTMPPDSLTDAIIHSLQVYPWKTASCHSFCSLWRHSLWGCSFDNSQPSLCKPNFNLFKRYFLFETAIFWYNDVLWTKSFPPVRLYLRVWAVYTPPRYFS